MKDLDKVRGFVKYKRDYDHYREPQVRAKDFREISSRLRPSEVKVQAARCMDCGVPFCQVPGRPPTPLGRRDLPC